MNIRYPASKIILSIGLMLTCSAVSAQDWSLSLGLGKSQASFKNLTDVDIQMDDSDSTVHLAVGYEVFENLSLNLSWIDLGEAEATFTTNTTDPTSLQRDNQSNVPVLGDGMAVSLTYDFYTAEGFTFFGEIGGYSWEADLNSDANGQLLSNGIDGTDIFFGIGAGYEVTERIESYFKITRYNLAPNNIMEWQIGFTYFL